MQSYSCMHSAAHQQCWMHQAYTEPARTENPRALDYCVMNCASARCPFARLDISLKCLVAMKPPLVVIQWKMLSSQSLLSLSNLLRITSATLSTTPGHLLIKNRTSLRMRYYLASISWFTPRLVSLILCRIYPIDLFTSLTPESWGCACTM